MRGPHGADADIVAIWPERMLSVSGLTKRYGGVAAVDRLSFDVRRGEVVSLLGPNGAGKSTTLNCIAGLLRPDAAARVEGDAAGAPPRGPRGAHLEPPHRVPGRPG